MLSMWDIRIKSSNTYGSKDSIDAKRRSRFYLIKIFEDICLNDDVYLNYLLFYITNIVLLLNN